uniref:Uncharacterized protein n=1 Tax=Picea glauca TaxID=3330 RepID=A0A117NGR8_PICGL|nr:hypothetical protein ABT39_MTgene6188 [Picea glauca]
MKMFMAKKCPRFSADSIKAMESIGDLYVLEESCYIRIFGISTTFGAPQALPKYVPVRLLV